MKHSQAQSGFTLIEILVVMGLIAILAGVVLVAPNPGRHFAQARNTRRTSDVATILNAIGQNMAENQGVFKCDTGEIPVVKTDLKAADGYDIAHCLMPDFISQIPIDPSFSSAFFNRADDYLTGYSIQKDQFTNRITVSAPNAELNASISVTR